MRVLIIENDPDTQQLISLLVRRQLFGVPDTVRDLAQAQVMLSAGPYDAVVADLALHEWRNGLGVRLAEIGAPLSRTILLTADLLHQRSDEEIRGLGVRAVLYKPFRLDDLLGLLMNCQSPSWPIRSRSTTGQRISH